MKPTLALIATMLTFVAYIPYIRLILKNKVKPHVFSWLIWGSTTTIAFFAQLSDGGGIGSWPTIFSALITFYIAWLGYKNKSDMTTTKLDWTFLTAAVITVPFWYFTDNALNAVIIITAVDLLGFGPTFRAVFHRPFNEDISFFAIFSLRNILAMVALESYSLTTLLFPASITAGCLALVLYIFRRRYIMKNEAA